jgi:hypothetical protein
VVISTFEVVTSVRATMGLLCYQKVVVRKLREDEV